MRYGFTTGSCAAAAAKAAAYMLLTGKNKNQITIKTPKGILYTADVLNCDRQETSVSCAVKKDGGDDPDITTGMLVYATVRMCDSDASIYIDGGEGVGRVTRPGLDQPVGSAAINHVPREMIEKEVREVCTLCDYNGSLEVIISVPGGEAVAQKTFNPRLGIVGGISILGTTGIVEPMSNQALLDTICVELRQKRAEGQTTAVVSPGNYGLDFMKKNYGYDLDQSVKCSNFIGETIDMAVELGFSRMILIGHIGKLIKLSGGIMNTHSKEADCRMELLAAATIRADSKDITLSDMQRVLACATTEEALGILQERGILAPVMSQVMERILFYLNKRAAGKMQMECILFSNEFGELARSSPNKLDIE
jgi:cobalt-precorrin-5B (C1)-methyltransferase